MCLVHAARAHPEYLVGPKFQDVHNYLYSSPACVSVVDMVKRWLDGVNDVVMVIHHAKQSSHFVHFSYGYSKSNLLNV